MQVKQTFLTSYADNEERQEAIKKIYRQLYQKFQYISEENSHKNKNIKKEGDLWL